MSDCIEEGCICSALGRMAPCSWCTSLTQTEADLLDTYGMEILRWLQTHYLLHKGEWDWEPGPEAESLEEFINASIILAQDDLNLRKGTFTKAYMQEKTPHIILSPMDAEGKRIKSPLLAAFEKINPTTPVFIYRDGMMLPKAILPSAQIFNLSDYRRTRRT